MHENASETILDQNNELFQAYPFMNDFSVSVQGGFDTLGYLCILL